MCEKKKGMLGYNPQTQRYGILSFDLWANDGLHCGATFEVYVNDEWISDRIEMSHDEWYLVKSKLKGEELEGLKIKY